MPFPDSSLWLVLVAALSAGVAVALVCLGVAWLLRRRRATREAALGRRLSETSARFEARLAELEREVERAREEARRARELAALGSSIDLDTVLSRTLESAAAVPGIDAAMIVLPEEGNGPLVATLGLSADEAARHPLAASAPGPGAPAVEVAYRYGADLAEAGEELVRGGVVLPLPGHGDDAAGSLAVFWRGGERHADDAELSLLEHLAATAAPAIANARRFREARKLADLDALTSLHNRRFFHDTLAREVARAHRYDRRLALVIFDIDDFKAINERVGHLAGDSVLAQLAERVRSVVRSADIACRVGGDEFAVVLPESRLADAEQLYRRLQFAVSTRPTGAAERLNLSAGIAELTPDDDAVSFFERADEALFRAKETGKGHASTARDPGAAAAPLSD